MDANNVLRRLKVEKCKWNFKVMTNFGEMFKCNRYFICGMHIHRREIYILLRNGDVFYIDLNGWRTGKVCQLDIPSHYLITNPYMFGTYSAIYAVFPEEKFQIYFQEEEQIVVACPGLTRALEHGHMLLLGYEDGKIEIFRTANLRKRLPPEIQFNLRSYSESLTTKIIALDIHEDKDCHRVFAATESSVYEFIICDK